MSKVDKNQLTHREACEKLADMQVESMSLKELKQYVYEDLVELMSNCNDTFDWHAEKWDLLKVDILCGQMNKTLYLHLEPYMISPESGATVEIKLGDEGIVVDAWSLDDCIASTWQTYDELSIEVKEIEDETN